MLSVRTSSPVKGLRENRGQILRPEGKVPELEQVIKGFFNPVTFSFVFLTATDLLASARRSPSSTYSLRLTENPISTGQEGFVCLVTLRDYLAFITDDDGH